MHPFLSCEVYDLRQINLILNGVATHDHDEEHLVYILCVKNVELEMQTLGGQFNNRLAYGHSRIQLDALTFAFGLEVWLKVHWGCPVSKIVAEIAIFQIFVRHDQFL
ncbi:hypothetical protein ALQ56_200484 [Pseudomonas syringae pv. papulans]|nr:hypothetical protein ALQ56_200484 [Pseudomonas syringae pv. papulans]